MTAPCGHVPTRPDTCRLCFLATDQSSEGASYRAMWEARSFDLPTPVPNRVSRFCRHLGPVVGSRGKSCAQCWTRECGLHDECTLNDPSAGLAVCSSCKDYKPPVPWGDDGPVRHLVYYLYPVRGPSWMRRVDEILHYMGQFNGKRVLGLSTDEKTATAGEVLARCGDVWTDVVAVQNDPALWEVSVFISLWERLSCYSSPRDITLYAHGKGCAHPWNVGEMSHRWGDMMAEVCLAYPDFVAGVLADVPLACPAKKVGYAFPGSNSGFHSSGSWMWARNADLFAKNWRHIDHVNFGSESYFGLHFRPDECGALLLTGDAAGMSLYVPDYWQRVVQPALDRWREERVSEIANKV